MKEVAMEAHGGVLILREKGKGGDDPAQKVDKDLAHNRECVKGDVNCLIADSEISKGEKSPYFR